MDLMDHLKFKEDDSRRNDINGHIVRGCYKPSNKLGRKMLGIEV